MANPNINTNTNQTQATYCPQHTIYYIFFRSLCFYSFYIIQYLKSTGAIHTRAMSSALAIAIFLGDSGHLDDGFSVALRGLNDFNRVGVSLLHALALVGTVAVAAGARHGYERELKKEG